MIKAHLGLEHVRLSRAETTDPISTFGVCPGAGGSVFEKLAAVDLLLTGEMRHHDVLARRARGTHVVLTDHTNTERAYLPHFAQDLAKACPGLSVYVSRADTDPLRVV
jgi:putative NIF3 family GTP cyclohydrolase 1 type 2